VVLPPQVKIPANQNLPADLLAGYGGGISIRQYEQLKNLPGIEVAAPITYMGYIKMPVPIIYFSNHSLPTGYYQLDWTLIAFDGQRHIVEMHESNIFYAVTNKPRCDPLHDPFIQVTQILGIQYGLCAPKDDPFISMPTIPDLGTFLLAGIDPAAEIQLVHLNKSITAGRMLNEQDTIHLDRRVPDNRSHSQYLHKIIPIDAIPMILHQQLPGQITLNATLVQLYTGPLTPDQIAARGGILYLQELPNHQTIFHGAVPLAQNDPQRFAGVRLLWNGYQWQTLLASRGKGDSPNYLLDFSSSYAPAGLTYRPMTAPDGSQAYTLAPTGIQEPEVAFRQLVPLHTVKSVNPQNPDVYYTFEAVGQFADNRLVAQLSNPLNWLPENTYNVPPVVLRYDAQGHPVAPATLLPTTNPAGYVMQPPLALTTLDVIRQLVGNHCINAIRVRVAGVFTASQESWKHIQQVAQEIHQQTGLQVVVTLGSSPRPMLVYVPGVKQGQFGATQAIAPVGWVEERWIQIAVGLTYLHQLGATRVLLLGAVLAVCLGYLVVAFSALLAAQRKEFAVLSALGWRPWQPAQLFLGQALLLAFGGGILGILVSLLIVSLLEAIPIWLMVVWTLPAILVLAFLSSLHPLWQIWHIQPAEILRAGSPMSPAKARLLGLRLWSFAPSIGALVVRNLARSRPRTVMTIGSLFLSAILLVLMLSSVLALRQTLIGTLLGNFVLLQTAVPQIAGCVFAVLLTFLSVADLLLLQVRERRQEIGLLQALGWRGRIVQRLLMQEGLTPAIIGTVPGVLVALGILTAQHIVQNIIPPPFVALSAVLLMVGVSALATIPALRTLNRMQVVDVLRPE
jgi:putative ABC transport system permease protein